MAQVGVLVKPRLTEGTVYFSRINVPNINIPGCNFGGMNSRTNAGEAGIHVKQNLEFTRRRDPEV